MLKLGATKKEIFEEMFKAEIENAKKYFLDYYDLMEKSIESAQNKLLKIPTENLDKYFKSGIPAEQEYASIKEEEYINKYKKHFNIFPRVLRQTFVVGLFSWFETAAEECAAVIGKRNPNFSNGLMNNIKKYFKKENNIDIPTDDQLWEFLKYFQSLRNFIVHMNANFSNLKEYLSDKDARYHTQMQKLYDYTKRYDGKYFENIDGYLLLKRQEEEKDDYIRIAINSISNILTCMYIGIVKGDMGYHMKKQVYNLKFPPYCDELKIFGYKFKRVSDYKDKLLSLQHLCDYKDEFHIKSNTGKHALTATVEIPKHEENTVLDWSEKNVKALKDILLLLSIFTGREVFLGHNEKEEEKIVIYADPRVYTFGGILRCSISYKKHLIKPDSCSYGIRFEEGLNKIYTLIRSQGWQKKYGKGYCLFLARMAFRSQPLEAIFTQCWTIWEHLFTIHNKNWLSEDTIRRMPAGEKIAFVLSQYVLKESITNTDRKKIQNLVNIRNRLIHFGRFPEKGNVYNNVKLFINMTEFVIAKVLSLYPSNVFNTIERMERFFNNIPIKSKKINALFNFL